MAKPNTEDFEALLARLEEIVEKLDGGGLGLEACMKLYEEGVAKSDRLTTMLAEARDRVMKLVTDKNGNSSLDIFDGENKP